MSRSDKTKKNYERRCNQLLKKCSTELKIPKEEDLDMRQFVVWLAEQRPKLSRATWRQYKSAATYFMETLPDMDASVASLEYLSDKTSVGCVLKSKKTSSQKLKHISLQEWERIDEYLILHKTKWSDNLRNWLKAGLLTGLRPIEWQGAKFFYYKDKIPALLVENAKNTNGRAHGPTRTLLLDALSAQELITIKEHLMAVRTFTSIEQEGYTFFYNGCSTTLYNACRKIWPRRLRHVTLYSTRHQFSSNAKSSGFSKTEVAAMMGHAVDITATIHYGKKINGNESVLIKPVSEEVSKIKQIKTIDFKEFIKKSKESGASSGATGSSSMQI